MNISMKLKIILGMIFLLAFAVHTPLMAEDGKTIYLEKCLKCHNKSMAEVISPAKKATVQWDRFFHLKKHNRFLNIESLLNNEEKNAVLSYLKKHASDSEQPEVAGKE